MAESLLELELVVGELDGELGFLLELDGGCLNLFLTLSISSSGPGFLCGLFFKYVCLGLWYSSVFMATFFCLHCPDLGVVGWCWWVGGWGVGMGLALVV